MLNEVGKYLPMDRVHFLGNLAYTDYLRVLQISRCPVYLTYPFVLSWSCLEAMAAGCTLVASNTGPVQEVVRHGENGLLVDFFDTTKLARSVSEVLETPLLFKPLANKARESTVERYDLTTKCLPELLALLP